MPVHPRPTTTPESPADSGSPARPRSRVLRWVPRVLAAGAALLVLVVGALVLLLPRERIARVATERAEAALGMPVEVAGIGLDLWPAPAVALEGARLGEAGAPVAAVGRIVLRPRILPLLSGQVSVRQIELDRPEVRLEIDADGRLNLSLPEGGEAAPSGGDVEFSVDELRIRDGVVAFRDARDGTRVRLAGIGQRLAIQGEVRAGELARVGLRGVLAVDSVDAELPGRLAAPLRGVSFAVEHDGSLDREADVLDLASLRLRVQRVALEGSGRVEALSDSAARRVDLQLGTDEFSADDLVRSLPEGLLQGMLAARPAERGGGVALDRAEVGGRASIQARVQGPVTADSLPRVEGVVRLAELSARVDGRPVLASLGGTVGFSNDLVSARALEGSLFGAPFRLAFRVEELAAPRVAFATSGTLSLEEAVALAGMQDSLSASGRLPFELQGTLHPSEPARSSVQGTVGLAGTRVSRPSLRQPVQLSGGQLRFAGERLHAESVQVGFGESRLRVDGTVSGWLPAALGDSTRLPEARFEVAAGLLDLDALLGPSESQYAPLLFARLADRPVDGRPAGEAAAAAGLALPELPRLLATGRIRAERLVRSGMEYREVDAQLEASPEAVGVPQARFGLMGGTVELGLALQRGADDATLVLDYELENVGAESFFARLTPFRGRLSGLLATTGSVMMRLDRHLLPVRPTVQATGSLALSGGSLAGWPVLQAVGERLGLASFDTLAFREWSGSYRIDGPLVSLQRAVQSGGGVETELAGSFDFAGRLDLGVVAHLPAALAARAGEPVRQAAAAAATPAGTIPLGLRLTGTSAAPQVALDLSAARDNAVAQARDRAREEAREAAESAARQVAGGLLPDSVPLRADSVAGAVRSRVTERLQGLFGRARGAAAPDSAVPDSATVPAGAPPAK